MDLSAISQKILSTQYLLLSTTGEKTPPAKNGLHLFLNWAKWPCIPYITSLIYHPCFFLGGGKHIKKKHVCYVFFGLSLFLCCFCRNPRFCCPHGVGFSTTKSQELFEVYIAWEGTAGEHALGAPTSETSRWSQDVRNGPPKGNRFKTLRFFQ